MHIQLSPASPSSAAFGLMFCEFSSNSLGPGSFKQETFLSIQHQAESAGKLRNPWTRCQHLCLTEIELLDLNQVREQDEERLLLGLSKATGDILGDRFPSSLSLYLQRPRCLPRLHSRALQASNPVPVPWIHTKDAPYWFLPISPVVF